VAMTCAPRPEANVLIRATAGLVADGDEAAKLWAERVLPYDPTDFFRGPQDPETQFASWSRPTPRSTTSVPPLLAGRTPRGSRRPGRAPAAASS
jgi:hypothetical protein